MNVIVGIDCSLRSAGVATISMRPDGTVTAETTTVRSTGRKSDTTRQRGERIRRQRNGILDLAYNADLVVIEAPAYQSSSAYQHDISWLWGAVYHGLMACRINVVDISPTKVKKFATDKGNAQKLAVAAAVTRMWPDLPQPRYDDEFDALALATMAAIKYRWPVPFNVLERHRLAVAGTDWPALAEITGT